MLYVGLEDATVLHSVEDAKIMAPVDKRRSTSKSSDEERTPEIQ